MSLTMIVSDNSLIFYKVQKSPPQSCKMSVLSSEVMKKSQLKFYLSLELSMYIFKSVC